MVYYLRKIVKFPHQKWKYKYLEGVTFFEIPPIAKDQGIVEFVNTWGDGMYEFVNSNKRYLIETKFPVDDLNFRATANRKGQPIIMHPRKKNHQRKPECASCHNRGYQRGKEKASNLHRHILMKLNNENSRLKHELSKYRQSGYQPISTVTASIATKPTPNSTTSMSLKTSDSRPKKKKLKENICPNCGTTMEWASDVGYYCVKCVLKQDLKERDVGESYEDGDEIKEDEEEEVDVYEEGEEEVYEEEGEEEDEGEPFIKCLSCGTEVSEEDIYCPNCGTKLEKEIVKLPPPIIETCPRCDEEFEIPFGEDSEIVLECPRCGRRGKISNPYFDDGG